MLSPAGSEFWSSEGEEELLMGAAGSPHLLFVEGEPCVPPLAAFCVSNTPSRPRCVRLPALLLKCCGTRAQAAAAAVLLLQAPCASPPPCRSSRHLTSLHACLIICSCCCPRPQALCPSAAGASPSPASTRILATTSLPTRRRTSREPMLLLHALHAIACAACCCVLFVQRSGAGPDSVQRG